MIKAIRRFYNFYLSPEKEFVRRLRRLLGFTPAYLKLFKLAFHHKSSNDGKVSPYGGQSNERLEYLGDTVLSTVVINYLYHKFPEKSEGELTELTSKIVNRKKLNELGKNLKIQNHIKYIKQKNGHKNLLGNALEAIIGAIYLDYGYKVAKKVIINAILKKHIKLKELGNQEKDPKSMILIWGQKTKNLVEFKGRILHQSTLYKSDLYINKKLICSSTRESKKLAERDVAQDARDILFLKE